MRRSVSQRFSSRCPTEEGCAVVGKAATPKEGECILFYDDIPTLQAIGKQKAHTQSTSQRQNAPPALEGGQGQSTSPNPVGGAK